MSLIRGMLIARRNTDKRNFFFNNLDARQWIFDAQKQLILNENIFYSYRQNDNSFSW